MNEPNQRKGVRTPQSRRNIRDASRAFHDANIQKAHDRVHESMLLIQQELAGNRGVYPHNKGVISQAEVARRASMHPVTLHKPHYRELVLEVQRWVEQVKAGAVVGHKRVRRDLKSRVQEHEELRIALQEVHRISETDLEHSNLQLQELEEKCHQLEEENRQLRQKLAKTAPLKIIKLSAKKR